MNKNNRKPSSNIWIYIVIALVTFVAMLIFANRSSLEYDDLATIGMCAKDLSFSEMIKACTLDDRNPILFHVILSLWLKIVPFGDVWVRLLPMTFVALSIFLCGLTGEKLRNTHTGIFLACLSALIMSRYCGLTIRPYGLLFLVSITTVYMYVIRCENMGNERPKEQIMLGIAFAALANTHYLGVLMVFALFIMDLVLVVVKKSNARAFISYAVCGILFLPWIMVGIFLPMLHKTSFLVESATSNPGDAFDLVKLIRGGLFQTHLASLHYILFAGFMIQIFALVALLWKKRFVYKRHFSYFAFTFVFVFIVTAMTAYSLKDTTNSLFAIRYFVAISPIYLLFIVTGFDMAFGYLLEKFERRDMLEGVLVAVVILLLAVKAVPAFYRSATRSVHPFRQVTDYLLAQKDIHSGDVLVLRAFTNCADKSNLKGWSDYYLTKDKTIDRVNLSCFADKQNLSGINKIYYCGIPDYGHLEDKAVLMNDFDMVEKIDDYYTPIEVYVRKK